MKIALVSDAWSPQVNGVVRTLSTTVAQLRSGGHVVETITPDRFRTIPCPSYPEIRLALGAGRGVAAMLARFAPDAVHIATEGPLGWAARRWCRREGLPFTTSFHTHFPDYLAMRTGLPPSLFWPAVRRFHAPAARVFAATATLERQLAAHGLPQTHRWSRGVDLARFSPDVEPLPDLAALPGPVLLYVGRVAVEKNVEAFLAADAPGSKVVVGDGPARADLARRFPGVTFTGALHGDALAAAYAAADLFVFPSRTDTFGLVLLEALASGLPIAAYPVPGPLDIVGDSAVGVLDKDLGSAIAGALMLDRAACPAFAANFGWDACTAQFLAGLAPTDTKLSHPRNRMVIARA
ncbi:glycosyltransferase family 4 protein [Sphingomonas jatrophae]|uniref:Glycosyltransferase involved in cell wall bisynthesis n=1 Tax=Sphingomonas jatrophae TaxID=1166337 RepID=A0A1I6JFD8_9SPHN|nr:glycosyltransferase family 1 protein [Sphingomonas jatrophae]SFR77320.1 Glycosyltransferase involved in cell wall bisynthesis [Sphingomonas jatrophae]